MSAIASAATEARPPALRRAWPVAVVFDMDGLLFNTEVLARKALHRSAATLDLPLTDTFAERLIGVPADVCREMLVTHFGPTIAADALLASAADELRAAIDGGALRLQPGVTAVLDWLDERGLPFALATSSSRDKAFHQLAVGGLTSRFHAIVTREDVARGKPFPDLYRKAASSLGFDATECLALEDSYNGVRAAHAADMPVVMIPDLLHATDEMQATAIAVLPDLHALIPWLDAQRRSPASPSRSLS